MMSIRWNSSMVPIDIGHSSCNRPARALTLLANRLLDTQQQKR
jgi:hypothetical protein